MISLINYNWMPTIANHVLDLTEEFYRTAGVSRLHSHSGFKPEDVKENDIVFVKTDYIYNQTFQKLYLPKIKNKFILISGISSYNVVGKEQEILDSGKLKLWFCTNPPCRHDLIVPLPIGFEEKERIGGNQEILNDAKRNAVSWHNKSDKLYLPYHDVGTNPNRDKEIAELAALDFVEVETQKLPFADYLKKLGNYKYVLCLSGAGYDTHRNYEVLLVGSTPVMLNTPLKTVFDHYNLPSIFLKSWETLESSYRNLMIKNKHNWDVTDFLNVNKHKERILKYAKN
jgi:hypothetical protein